MPIVSAAVLFDLHPGELVAPDAEAGYAACAAANAIPESFAGRIGAGAGVTFQKMWGEAHIRPGGIGIAKVETGSGAVSAVLALNAVGTFVSATGSQFRREALLHIPADLGDREATTIGAVIVHGESDRDLLIRCAIAAHDGLARSIVPSHTLHDGDIFWAAGPNPGQPGQVARLQLPLAAELAVEAAIRAIATLTIRT